MLKNKLKIIAILMIIILAIMVPFVRAENEENGVMPISEGPNSDATNNADDEDTVDINSMDGASNEASTTSNTDDSFRKGDVYLTGDNVTVDYIVDGNLFIIANTVTVNSQIGGDAFICANSVTIGEEGYVFSNLFTLSQTVDIKGVVYDLYASCKNVNISGYVYRDIKVSADVLNIYGTIGRNAFVNCNTISLGAPQEMQEGESTTVTTQGTISGDLTYTSSKEVTFPDNAITGQVHYSKPTTSTFNTTHIFMSLGSMIAGAIIIWLLCLWIAPKFLKNCASLIGSKKILPVIGLGLATPIVFTIAMVLLFIIGITSSIAFLTIALLAILIALATSIFLISINNLVCQKLKIEKTIGIFGMLIVCSIALWAIELIPYVGTFIGFIAVILGIGIIISSIVLKEKTIAKEKTV